MQISPVQVQIFGSRSVFFRPEIIGGTGYDNPYLVRTALNKHPCRAQVPRYLLRYLLRYHLKLSPSLLLLYPRHLHFQPIPKCHAPNSRRNLGYWTSPITLLVMAFEDLQYKPKDTISSTLQATGICGSAGLFISAIRNSLKKQNVGALGVFTRTGAEIAVFGSAQRGVPCEKCDINMEYSCRRWHLRVHQDCFRKSPREKR